MFCANAIFFTPVHQECVHKMKDIKPGCNILQRLQCADFNGIGTELKEFLQPVLDASNLQSLSDKERKYRADVAVRFLHSLNSCSDSLPRDVLSSSVNSVLNCVHCCTVVNLVVKDPLTVAKLLVHLVSKYVKLPFLLIDEACILANCLINSLLINGLPLSADSANLADVTAAYLRRGCQDMSSNLSKDRVDSTVYVVELRGLCQALKLIILGSKDISRIPSDFSVILKTWKLCLGGSINVIIAEEVGSLFSFLLQVANKNKTQCLPLVCCLMEMTVKYASALLLYNQGGKESDVMASLKMIFESELPSSTIGQSDRVAMLALVEVFGQLIEQVSAKSLSNNSTSQLADNVALLCAEKVAVKLKDFAGFAKKVRPDTFVSILHVIDHVVDLLLGCEKTEVICESRLEAVILLLDLRTQLCGQCRASLRAHLLAESRARLVDFLQLEVCSQIRRLELLAVLVQNNFTDPIRKEKFMKALSSLEEFICRFASEKLLTPFEHVSFGNLTFRVGWQFYSNGCFAEAVLCLKMCVTQHHSYVSLNPTEADLVKAKKKFQISKTFEVLSDALKKLNRFDEAMSATVDCYLEDESHPSTAVIAWLRIMTKMPTGAGPIRTLTRCVKEKLMGTPKQINELILLEEELKAIQKSKSAASGYHRAILDELMCATNCDKITLALALIDKAYMTNSSDVSDDSSSSAADLCCQAIKLLDSVDKNKQNNYWMDVKARAFTLMYLLRSPDHVDKLFESASSAITNVSRKKSSELPSTDDEDNEDNEDNSNLFTVCSQLAAEDTLLEPVNSALLLWEACFSPKNCNKIDEKLDLSVSVDNIEVVVLIYKLMQSTRLLRAIQLLLQVASLAGDLQRRLVAETELLLLCNSLHQTQIAFGCIKRVESWLDGSDVRGKFPRLYIEFILAKAETLLQANKLDQCSSLLEVAHSCRVSSLKPSSKDHIIVEASTSLLEAKLRTLALAAFKINAESAGAHSDYSLEELPLELAINSTRVIAGLIRYMFSEKRIDSARYKGGECMVEKWRIIDLFCRSIFYAGVCYVEVGDQRDAKCYLLQCLRFCEAFRLRKRFAQIHVTLAQLSIISGRFSDCCAHLNIIGYILNPRYGNQSALTVENKDSDSTSLDSQLNLSLSEDVEGSDFIKSRELTLNYRTVADLSGSPTRTLHAAIKLPVTWTHDIGCECTQCTDPVLENIWLSCCVVDALLRLRQGQTTEAEKMLSAALKQNKRVIINARRFLKDLNSIERADDVEASAESIFQAVFSEINVRLCELALTKAEDIGKFSNLYTLALDFIKSNYASLASSHMHLSELYYFSSMPSLTWPSAAETSADSQISAIDMLCAGIGRMKATDVSTPQRKGASHKSSVETSDKLECAVVEELKERVGRQGRKKTETVVAAPVKKRPTARVLGSQRGAMNVEMMELPRKCAPAAVDNNLVSCKLPVSQTSTSDASSSRSSDMSVSLYACDRLQWAFGIQQQNPTAPLYRNICNTLAAELLMGIGKDDSYRWSVGHYLTEAQSSTFRHSCLHNIHRKLRKLEVNDNVESSRQALLSVRKRMMFGTSLDDFRDIINHLPDDLVVCQLSVVAPVGRTVGQLYLTRFQKDISPLTVSCPGYSTPEGQKLLLEFEAIMLENRNSMIITDRTEWWSRRRDLDTKLHDLLKELECLFVGCWRGILLGHLVQEEDRLKVDSAVSKIVSKFKLEDVDQRLLRSLLEVAHIESMSDQSLATGLRLAIGSGCSKQTVIQLTLAVKQSASRLSLNSCTRGTVAVVLDRSIQHMPWESMPCLTNQSMVRLPSVHFLSAHHHSLANCPSSVFNSGISRQSIYYVVNPDNNLPNTQQTFQSWFEKEPGWRGVIGRRPTANEMIDGITNHDLFVYCGHGTGSSYLIEETLQMQSCRAAVMLMGCSSGRLVAHGELDAAGTLLHYFLAGSGCIIGNLWDVTDRDIDRFQEVTLRSWFNGSGDTSLQEAMREGRSACKLRWLTGAAPVVYGFPIKMARAFEPDVFTVEPTPAPSSSVEPAASKRRAGKRTK